MNASVDQSAVGRRIRLLRTQKQMSLREVAREAGIQPGQLSRIETGKQGINVDLVTVIAKALGIKPSDVFDDKQMPVALAHALNEVAQLDEAAQNQIAEMIVNAVRLWRHEPVATERGKIADQVAELHERLKELHESISKP
jgi:transcriptional regulator with XRE-family HTH domain